MFKNLPPGAFPVILMMMGLLWACACLQPALGDTAMDEGMAQLRNKNYAQAFYSFETAKRNPAIAPQASYYQAMCYYGLGKVDYARTMLRTTIDRYPQAQIAGTAREALDRINREGSGTAASTATGTAAGNLASTAETEPGQSAEVSYKRDRSGRMIVNVLLNGKTLYPMLVDTGADVCSMTQEQAVAAGIDLSKPLRRTRLYGVAGETAAKIYRTRMQIGRIANDVEVFVEDSARNDYAILGRNFFGNLALEVDDTRHTLRFCNQKDMRVNQQAAQIPYRSNGHGLCVTVKINGRECEMIFDTGCSTISFTDKQWSALGMTTPTSANQGTSAGLGGSREARMFPIGSMELGGIIKYNVPAHVSIYGTTDKPLLGMSFLQGLRYVIDPYSQRIYISK